MNQWSKIAQKGIFGSYAGKHCGWPSLQHPSRNLVFCGRPMEGWHVKCWCRLREVENAGEASQYLKIVKKNNSQPANLHVSVVKCN